MKTLGSIQSVAPGKIILSGEHAVVYGGPALAMAINHYVTTTVLPKMSPPITFHLSALGGEHHFTLTMLEQLNQRLRQDYQRFIAGDLPINAVLQAPLELAQFVLILLLEEASRSTLLEGVHIRIQSGIPYNSGMGSSAAMIISVMRAWVDYLQMDLSAAVFLKLARQAENMQHGCSSGLDLQISLQGGCVYYKEGKLVVRLPPTVPLYLVNTGIPQTSTGECVTAAASHFTQSKIGKDFSAVTEAMDNALQQNKWIDIIYAVRENHKLLTTIGVVPEKIQHFITAIEQESGSAAKICGAGAVAGNNAGMVLVVTEDLFTLQKIALHYQYSIFPIQCEQRGAYVN
jgi:mevalonate kinase